ncbi:hypothetical protein PAXRUDRAFT_779329 [Paxillus rubicundulus Ve08.2h10]|uniref:ubiquitinyl hydrolase 1 n=1 Tax=Paxillus rubicundulus Ve08.2h10 TaxID=930991 RepID=A0A0D0DR03_9AGAM|nr:hypothetical protein PAXRUDRAFT_779329 [Paxillus rubicundulus Ve08.2h10]
MAPLVVRVQHSGKTYDVQLDPDLPPAIFKDAVYQVTGVPPDRMKVIVNRVALKDDADWKAVAPKSGQKITVIGTAGELPKPPEKPTVFLEDMDDSEIAEAVGLPFSISIGHRPLTLGNTCYMNSTVQAMRAIPELQIALNTSSPIDVLPRSLRDLFSNMSRTTESVVPASFLTVLRQVIPQFGEVDRSRADAEECWSQMTNALKEVPAIDASGSSIAGKKFVDQFLAGEMRRELKCDESPEEPPTITSERVLKLVCNISISTNYMHTGILETLNSHLTKHSPSLGREATYSQTSRLSRLPGYLTLHMVRFAWRQDIGKKTKIMRKVKFTTEFDALDIVTPELKDKLTPVSRRLKEIEKERTERRKVRKRTKNAQPSNSAALIPVPAPTPVPAPAVVQDDGSMSVDEPTAPVPGDLEDESVYRTKELAELEALVDPGLKADFGCTIVTHKGAQADSGHYIGFVKKSVFHGGKSAVAAAAASTSGKAFDEDDEDWYKFDDDKVSIFPKEKLRTIDGGGEDSSAYVLLYKSKSLV